MDLKLVLFFHVYIYMQTLLTQQKTGRGVRGEPGGGGEGGGNR